MKVTEVCKKDTGGQESSETVKMELGLLKITEKVTSLNYKEREKWEEWEENQGDRIWLGRMCMQRKILNFKDTSF